MTKIKYSILSIIALLTIGCGQTVKVSPSADYMVLDTVELVEGFPTNVTLTDGKLLDIKVAGARDFAIIDTLLIVASNNGDGMWSFFSTNGYKYLGKYLAKGNGPGEFLQSPYASQARFIKNGTDLHALIYDFAKGKLYDFNISETLKNQSTSIVLLSDLTANLFNVVAIDSTRFFCREVDPTFTQQNRYFIFDGTKNVTNHLEKLNYSKIKNDEDINILSAHVKVNEESTRIIEVPIGLNYFNLYDISGSFGKTIYTGKEVFNIQDVQAISKPDRIYTYGELRIYPAFFALLSYNVSDKTFQASQSLHPNIQIFGWDGTPLFEFKTDRFFSSFEFDIANNLTYVFDNKTEEFYVYQIPTE